MRRWFIFCLALLMLLGCIGCRAEQIKTGSTGASTAQTSLSAGTSQPTVSLAGSTVTLPVPSETVTEPTQTEPQPTQTEPAATETIPSEPQPTEPAPTEPQPTEPEPEPEPEDDDFVRVIDYIPGIRQELAYATENNFTGQVIYDFTDAYLRYGTVKKLALACEELAQQGIGILIWDGFRPVSAQAKLWQVCPDPAYVSPPGTGTQSHCRGIAVDVTLVDLETGELLPVPSGFDEFSAQGDRDYSDCGPEAAQNALLLEKTMEKYGFKPYSAEWWHFSDTDSYPIDENFDPGAPMTWVANCNQYINLRKTAGGTLIGRVYKDESVELLEWSGKYAKVVYNGTVGYVSAAYIKPADSGYYDRVLDTVSMTNMHTYEQLMADMQALVLRYPDMTAMETVGYSELGREIVVLRIGKEDAEHHVLLQGAIHGREHLTAWLLMAMADYWLDHGILGYGSVCYHIIPMCNPDGVVTSQTGVLTDVQREIYLRDYRSGYTTLSEAEYAAQWKANGLGVDLNRNFPAGWDAVDGRSSPSSQLYPGEIPFSAAEAQVLRDYTLRYSFDATVSYHATGSLIYYEYGDAQPVNGRSKALANKLEAVTGYPLQRSAGVDGAGYKDWAIDELLIPSLTVEIGCSSAPLAQREIYSIFVRNRGVLPAIARWIADEK